MSSRSSSISLTVKPCRQIKTMRRKKQIDNSRSTSQKCTKQTQNATYIQYAQLKYTRSRPYFHHFTSLREQKLFFIERELKKANEIHQVERVVQNYNHMTIFEPMKMLLNGNQVYELCTSVCSSSLAAQWANRCHTPVPVLDVVGSSSPNQGVNSIWWRRWGVQVPPSKVGTKVYFSYSQYSYKHEPFSHLSFLDESSSSTSYKLNTKRKEKENKQTWKTFCISKYNNFDFTIYT